MTDTYVHTIAGSTGGGGGTTNTLQNNGDNTVTSTVNGIDSTTGVVTSNELSLVGSNLKSIVNGVDSNTVTISGTGITTNTLVNNNDNTLTSTVDGVASTPADIVQSVLVSNPDSNHVTVEVNGVGTTQALLVASVTNSTASNQMSVAVNGVTGTPAQIVTVTSLTKPDTNHIVSSVNAIASISTPLVETNTLTLGGNNLKTSVNSLDSSTVAVQIPIPSPVLDNLVAMDGSGFIKDAGISVTTSPASNDNMHLPTSAAVQTNLALKSPLNSPAFAGVPTAPTASPGTNTTQLATTAFVAASAAAGVTSFNTRTGAVAPLSGDYSYNQVTGAAPLASPNFTGTPTAPTQTQGDNTTKLATTAYTDTGLALKANIASPALTGTPTAPTAAPGTNTTQLATTAFVAASAAAGVTSFNGRTGAVVPATNDYTFPQINGVATVVKGGTGISTYTTGDLIVASGNTTLTTIAAPATGRVFISNGVGVAPSFSQNPVVSTISATNTTSQIILGTTNTATITTASLSGPVIFTLPNANSNPVQPSTAPAGQFATGISSTGVISYSGPISQTNLVAPNKLNEYIVAIAPNVNAIGIYGLRFLSASGDELDIIFSICGNQNTISRANATIQIIQISDTQGVITSSNISSYLLFRGYLRNTTPNSYFILSVSTPYTLVYSNPISLTASQRSFSFLNDSVITGAIVTDVSNFVAVYPADLIFYMNLTVVTTSISTPQGYFYAASNGGGAVFQYSINPLTGVPTALSPTSVVVPTPNKIATTKLRNYLYATYSNGGVNNISMFAITSGSGTLVPLSTPTISAPTNPRGIAVDPTNRFVYVCGSSVGVVQSCSITKSTGILVFTGTVGGAAGMEEIAVHPSGKFVYAVNQTNGNIYQYSADPITGILTQLSPLTIATTATAQPNGIVISPNGKFLYVSTLVAGNIYQFSIDPTTGQLTPLSTPFFSVGSTVFGPIISQNGQYILYGGANTFYRSVVSPTTGLITTPTPNFPVNGAGQCSFDFTGSYVFVIGNTPNQIFPFTFNQNTGVLATNGAGVAVGTNCNSIVAI